MKFLDKTCPLCNNRNYIGLQYKHFCHKETFMKLEDVEYWKSLINIGLTKIFILKILSMRPNHGYGILKELQSLTQDCCSPTFGTIYPILKNLTREGYTRVKESQQLKGGQRRRVYTLTPLGVKAYRVAMEAWKTTIPYIHRAIESKNADVKKKGAQRNA